MKAFRGFPAKTKYTSIPNAFFGEVLPQIDDIAELKVTLYVMWAVYQKRGYPRYVNYRELLGSPTLMNGLVSNGSPSQLLQSSLAQAVSRGTLLHLTVVDSDGEAADLYFVNTDVDRRAVARIKNGELKLGEMVIKESHEVTRERPNIYSLYEQNIGMLSPIIAEELGEAEKIYPAPWIEDAFREAVDLNKRNWRYISRILERWAAEGRDDGEPGRRVKAESDPEEYYRRYRHLLKR
ncbi:MAG: DnaD domain protein [Dehalococcoidia bacterium]|nr:MAG: DnaD domain protein [Dehalococcoidia bacterium]